MLNLTFKLDSKSRMYITDEFYTNGHWLVRRASLVKSKHLNSAFKPLVNMPNGSYDNGYKNERTKDTTPNIQSIIPSLSEYKLALLSGRVTIGYSQINQVEIESEDKSVNCLIDPLYLPLLSLGKVFIISGEKPIIITDEVDDTIVALIMPIRK